MKNTTLDEMPFDHPGTVAGFDEFAVAMQPENGAVALRLIELGVGEGARIVKRHSAPITRDPIAVEIGSHMVAMRRADARLVLVVPEVI